MSHSGMNAFLELEQYSAYIEAKLRSGRDSGCEKFCGEITSIRDTLLVRIKALGITTDELETNDASLLAKILA